MRNNAPRLFLASSFLVAIAWWLLESALHTWVFQTGPFRASLLPSDPNELWMRAWAAALFVVGGVVGAVLMGRLVRLERRNEQLHRELEIALVKLLSGFVSICSYCKSVRDPEERWEHIDRYLASRTDLVFSHGICPDCFEKHFPDEEAPVAEQRPSSPPTL